MTDVLAILVSDLGGVVPQSVAWRGANPASMRCCLPPVAPAARVRAVPQMRPVRGRTVPPVGSGSRWFRPKSLYGFPSTILILTSTRCQHSHVHTLSASLFGTGDTSSCWTESVLVWRAGRGGSGGRDRSEGLCCAATGPGAQRRRYKRSSRNTYLKAGPGVVRLV